VRGRAGAALLYLVTAQCTPSEEAVLPSAPTLPEASTADPGQPTGGPPVAVVNGSPIRRDVFGAEVARDPTLAPREHLERLIGMELLAQRGVREGLLQSPEAVARRRQALARAYLRQAFEREVTPLSITEAQVAELFQRPAIHKLYDYPADAWRMAHLYIQACDPVAEDCSRPEIQVYFDTAEQVLRGVWQALEPRSARVSGDPERVIQEMQDFRAEVVDRVPNLMFEDFAFYYDPARSHHEQKGYSVVAEGVARTVIDAPLGVLQPPARSTFGWHLIVKLDRKPEKHLSAADPEVVSDIRKQAFPRFQEHAFKQRMADLRSRYGAQTMPAALDALGPGLD
jgi:hypothetical protein